MSGRDRILAVIRRLHLCIGVVCAAYVLLLGGLIIGLNHRHSWGLDGHHISRTWLPAAYRAAEPQVRADVLVADLHAGILGPEGSAIVEGLAVLALVTLISGGFLYLRRPLRPQIPAEPAPEGKYPFPVIAGGKPRDRKVLTVPQDR